MKSEELSVDLNCIMAQIWELKHFCSTGDPTECTGLYDEVLIIKTLPTHGCPPVYPIRKSGLGRWPRPDGDSERAPAEENFPEGHFFSTPLIMLRVQMEATPSKRFMTACLDFANVLSHQQQQKSLVLWNNDWTLCTECQVACLEETRHHLSPGQYCSYCGAWGWWQHHAARMIFSSRN